MVSLVGDQSSLTLGAATYVDKEAARAKLAGEDNDGAPVGHRPHLVGEELMARIAARPRLGRILKNGSFRLWGSAVMSHVLRLSGDLQELNFDKIMGFKSRPCSCRKSGLGLSGIGVTK